MKAALVVRGYVDPMKRVPITADAVMLGRNDDNDVVLESPRVSRYHARISWNGAAYHIEDLESRNGTWVNGVRISQPTGLKHGDAIQIGDVAVAFEVQGKRTLRMNDGTARAPDGLTPREAEILGYLAAGKANADIAETLVLSVRTVERHVTNAYAKIGARNRSEATAYAISRGLA